MHKNINDGSTFDQRLWLSCQIIFCWLKSPPLYYLKILFCLFSGETETLQLYLCVRFWWPCICSSYTQQSEQSQSRQCPLRRQQRFLQYFGRRYRQRPNPPWRNSEMEMTLWLVRLLLWNCYPSVLIVVPPPFLHSLQLPLVEKPQNPRIKYDFYK